MFNAANVDSTSGLVRNARRAHLMVYDIPTTAKFNPSSELWRWGARVNLSAWIIPDYLVPTVMAKAKEWEAKGAKIEFVRFDERDGDKILDLARRAMSDEMRRIRESMDDAVDAVAERLRNVDGGDRDAFKRIHGHGYSASRRARLAIERMAECAATFDLTGDVNDLLEAVRQRVKAREVELWAQLDAHEKHLPAPVAATNGDSE